MLQIPTPGAITNITGIPNDLRAINQWVVWKPTLRGNKLTKVPVSYADPLGPNVDAHDPLYWATFDEAVEVMQRDPRFGIGLVLDGTGIICIDYDNHPGDDQEAVRNGAAFTADIMLTHPTYAEYSLQGGGKHIFYRAVLPHGRTTGMIDPLNVEIYAAQFMAITGNNTIGSLPYIAHGQDLVDGWRIPPPVAGAGSIDKTTALGRSLNLTDAEVISTMIVRRASIFKMMSSGADLNDRSTAYSQIIGDLDKITGDPFQIDRIIRKCPFFKNGYNSSKYEQVPKWLGKYQCSNMLEYWLKQARTENTESIQYAEVITPERKAFLDYVITDIANRTVAVKQASVDTVVNNAVTEAHVYHDVQADSPIARLVYMAEDLVGGNFDKLTLPPGVAGQFCNELGSMLPGPRLTYVLPAVISVLAGYIAQTFKLPGFDIGGVTQFMIAGKMNTGKTTTMTTFASAVAHALHGRFQHPTHPWFNPVYDNEFSAPLRTRIIDSRAVSVQGMFDQLALVGSTVWFADEAESQLDLMMNNSNHLGVALKGFVKQSHNSSNPYLASKLDASRASSRAAIPDIINMTLPFYWATTSEVYEKLSYKEMLDGMLSRIILIYDETPMSAKVEDETRLAKGFTRRLGMIMRRLAMIADYTAAGYDQQGLHTLLKAVMEGKGKEGAPSHEEYRVKFNANTNEGASRCKYLNYSPAADALRTRIRDFCRLIGSEADTSGTEWPRHYTLMARAEVLANSVASILAVCDMVGAWDDGPEKNDAWHSQMPQVTIHEEHLQWAFEFVMYWRLSIFKAWDQGRIAIRASSDMIKVEECIKLYLNNPNHRVRVKQGVWAPETVVIAYAQRQQPFASLDEQAVRGRTAGDWVRATIKKGVEDGLILRMTGEQLEMTSSKNKTFLSLAVD